MPSLSPIPVAISANEAATLFFGAHSHRRRRPSAAPSPRASAAAGRKRKRRAVDAAGGSRFAHSIAARAGQDHQRLLLTTRDVQPTAVNNRKARDANADRRHDQHAPRRSNPLERRCRDDADERPCERDRHQYPVDSCATGAVAAARHAGARFRRAKAEFGIGGRLLWSIRSGPSPRQPGPVNRHGVGPGGRTTPTGTRRGNNSGTRGGCDAVAERSRGLPGFVAATKPIAGDQTERETGRTAIR